MKQTGFKFGGIGNEMLQKVGEAIADDKREDEKVQSQAMADFLDFMEFSEIRC